MKVCATVCEYNPLHNGHVTHLNYIKNTLSPDLTVVIMSGNFVERGEVAILDKYQRAIHAIKAGADVVFELPTVFSVANAEIFASGGMKLINSLCGEKSICFGAETGDKESLISTAKILLNEPKEVKNYIKTELKSGVSFVKARSNAYEKLNISGVNTEFLTSPNNILAVEYAKSILKNNYNIEVFPLKRESSEYSSTKIKGKNASALAIRNAISNGKKRSVKNTLPKFVYDDLPKSLPDFSREILYSLNLKTKQELTEICDVTEGLENKIKEVLKSSFTASEVIENLKSKRYTETRLKRILICSLLSITEKFQKDCLKNDLYLKVLAVKKDSDALKLLSNSAYPLITRKSDFEKLNGVQKECFLKDVFANEVYSKAVGIKTNEFDMKIL